MAPIAGREIEVDECLEPSAIEDAACLTTLHLADLPARLEALNKAFSDLATKRSDGRAATRLPLASKVRPRTDAAYERILFTLRSNYLFGSTPIEKPELDAAWKQSMAQKKRTPRKPSVPKEPKQPKEPKEPKDPKQPKDPKKPGGSDPKDPKDPKKPGGDGNPDITLLEE